MSDFVLKVNDGKRLEINVQLNESRVRVEFCKAIENKNFHDFPCFSLKNSSPMK